jgi:hypothetical protein
LAPTDSAWPNTAVRFTTRPREVRAAVPTPDSPPCRPNSSDCEWRSGSTRVLRSRRTHVTAAAPGTYTFVCGGTAAEAAAGAAAAWVTARAGPARLARGSLTSASAERPTPPPKPTAKLPPSPPAPAPAPAPLPPPLPPLPPPRPRSTPPPVVFAGTISRAERSLVGSGPRGGARGPAVLRVGRTWAARPTAAPAKLPGSATTTSHTALSAPPSGRGLPELPPLLAGPDPCPPTGGGTTSVLASTSHRNTFTRRSLAASGAGVTTHCLSVAAPRWAVTAAGASGSCTSVTVRSGHGCASGTVSSTAVLQRGAPSGCAKAGEGREGRGGGGREGGYRGGHAVVGDSGAGERAPRIAARGKAHSTPPPPPPPPPPPSSSSPPPEQGSLSAAQQGRP